MHSESLKKEMRQYAYLHIQTIFVKVNAVYGLGLRTNSSESSNLQTKVDHARMQIGNGHGG